MFFSAIAFCHFKSAIISKADSSISTTKTGVVLFHDKNRNKFMNMLELVKQGYASDPPNVSMYIPKTDRFGRKLIDKDGLTLYRSIRGTSNLESLHQYLTTSFGHTVAGPWYSDVLLAIVRHFYNWRMSIKNRPNFPTLMHYNGLMIDRINNLYELIFGHTKHRDWGHYNDLAGEIGYVVTKKQQNDFFSYQWVGPKRGHCRSLSDKIKTPV